MDNSKIIDVAETTPRINVANFFDLKEQVRSWGPRTLTDVELILIREGIYDYKEEGLDRLILTPGDLLAIPPMRRHELALIEKNKGIPGIACIHNHPLGKGKLLPDIPRRTSLSPDDFTTMTDLFERIARIFNGNRPYRQELLDSLCRQVWLMLGAYWKSAGPSAAGEGESRMEKMLFYIRENSHRKITRTQLAREFGLTPEYVNALFKKELGLSPTRCINREKIHRGYVMLHNEGLSVKEAAFKCGFIDEYYFARLFKKILGISPGAVKGGGYPAELKRLRETDPARKRQSWQIS